LFITGCFNPTGTCPAAAYTVGGIAQESGIVGATPDASAGAGNVAYFDKLMTAK
jgi:hypothetical protein